MPNERTSIGMKMSDANIAANCVVPFSSVLATNRCFSSRPSVPLSVPSVMRGDRSLRMRGSAGSWARGLASSVGFDPF